MIDAGSDGVLADTIAINHRHPIVSDTAREIVAGESEPERAIAALFEWVRDEIVYDMAPDLNDRESWRASDTIERVGLLSTEGRGAGRDGEGDRGAGRARVSVGDRISSP